jgi:hypothetical protein
VNALDAIRRWGEARDWRGYDPYDALNSPFAPYLTLGTTFGRRALTQVVKGSPVNLRPLLRVAPDYNDKALALVASAYARLAAARSDGAAAAAARRWLDRVIADAVVDETGRGWGYHFDVQTRFFGYAKGTPNTIATSFVAHALLDGLELLGDPRFGDAAAEASGFLRANMLAAEDDTPFFRYLEKERELVHNANLLACSVVVRTSALRAEPLDEGVAAAVATSVDAQRADGSWPYAAGEAGDWVDNFHTGYVLESLGRCRALVGDVGPALERGFDFWERELFMPDGRPKPSPGRRFPVDAHDFAQAIETWLSAADWRSSALELAGSTADLMVRTMLNPDGYVDFRHGRFLANRVPFIRWTTAPAFRALAGLELARCSR